MPLQQTSGAASYDAFGGGAPVAAKYIEDFFQTWLRTGTGSSTTVTTGLNASINKSLVGTKSRSAATNHKLTDTARGVTKALSSNTTGAEVTDSQGLTAFSSTGYTIGTNTDYNNSGATYVDWQLVATPKFFDVVTYTGNGTLGRTVSHSLGSVPGCIIIKRTNTTSNWQVYHRGLSVPESQSVMLNSTASADASFTYWNSTLPTATEFTLGTSSTVNANGSTYVAYIFAHNAGGFGLTGTDNVISCGSYTGNGSTTGPVVTLGYEPQWLLIKNASDISNWTLVDNMRGMSVLASSSTALLYANLSNAEAVDRAAIPLATGFQINDNGSAVNTSGATYIYIAIRRGPMRTPTTGTSVFTPYQVPASPTTGAITGFVTDAGFIGQRAGADKFAWGARLMGNPTLNSTSSTAESANTNQIWDRMNGWWNTAINNYMTWGLARAPGFMDVVCYTGTGTTGQTYAHNLGVAPEMMIVKSRTVGSAWYVYTPTTGNTNTLVLNSTAAVAVRNVWGDTTPTASVFSVGTSGAGTNNSGATYVAYLFASCPGVSKVFNYTGNGSSQTINCGFTGGARFVMIKRTDSTGDWYVWDTARGIVANNDPHLSLNSTAAEVTTNDTIDTDSTGFVVNQVAATNVNVSSATYIGLAIA